MFLNKQKCLFTAIPLAVFIGLSAMPFAAAAAVREVTLFPQSAKVEETIKISQPSASINKNQVVIILPPQAEPESLVVSPPSTKGVRIDDIQIKSVTRADDDRIAQLRTRLKNTQHEKKEAQARLKALDVQLQFWQAQTKTKTKSVADADNIASAIGRNSRKIYSDMNTIETELERLEKQIKELQDNLNQAAGKTQQAYEAVMTLSGSMSGEFTLSYSYIMSGCGWQPLYRLEALPSSNSIVFSWDAELWQSTGEDWKSVQIHLATLQPVRTIAPQVLPPWIIKPQTSVIHKSSRKLKSAPAALEAVQADDSSGEAIPSEKINTTYAVWSLGKKTLMAGSRQRLKIKDETWPAQFLFLARPSLSPQAFVQARIKLANPVEIPSGQAIFLMDGALIGKREFALAGTETDVYFGNSPFITVSSLILADTSGASRILQNKQTRQWLWRIEAKNAGSTPVRLRIEEPVPQPRDERIKLSFKHNPEPSEKDTAKFVWLLDLPALQKKDIEYGIELTAPAEMPLDFGWRH